MRQNLVKQKLLSGKTSYGTMVFEFNTTGIARIISATDAEFVVFDMEHTGWSVENIRMLMATACKESALPFVRVPATEYHFIARVLDMGAMGIMVPMVESVSQATAIVEAAKYPPLGKRGSAFGIAHDDYQAGSLTEKIQTANQEQLLIAQIETVEGLENVDMIAAVNGIDVLWVGQTDLSNSMGIPGQFDHPDFHNALKRVAEVANAHGKIAAFMAMSPQEAKLVFDYGYRCIAYSGDLWIYQQALRKGIKECKQLIEE